MNINFINRKKWFVKRIRWVKLYREEKIMMDTNYRIAEDRIAHYRCRRVEGGFPIDGDLEKPVWKQA
jgi:hypothetical protein